MEITNVTVELDPRPSSKVLAYCEITIDDMFVVHDIKLLLGENGEFVSMPSKKQKQPCWNCKEKVECTCAYCTSCGAPGPHRLNEEPEKRYHDVAHPITAECRDMVHRAIVEAYEQQLNSR